MHPSCMQFIPAVLREQLITVGGGSAIHAYSPSTKFWVHVGDLPIACDATCTLVLPTGGLLVVEEDESAWAVISFVHCKD